LEREREREKKKKKSSLHMFCGNITAPDTGVKTNNTSSHADRCPDMFA
jgi:hypothetical protein